MIKRHGLLLSFLLMSISSVLAQGNEVLFKDTLAQLGFENIRVKAVANNIYVALENSTYRATYRGAGVALTAFKKLFPDTVSCTMVMLENKMPRVRIKANCSGDNWNVEVDYQTSEVMELLKEEEHLKNSSGKIDITFYPIISLDNHRFDRLFGAAFSIAPAIETTLWKGSRLTLQPVFPIWNNLYKGSYTNYIHLGVVALQQNFLAKNVWRGTAAIGFFQTNRVGLHADVSYRLTSRLETGIKVGLTGYSIIDENGWSMGMWNKLSILAKASYYEPISSLNFEFTGGRFTYGDYGARADCTRYFGEYAIGIYGVYCDGEHNAGFHFSIPLGGKKQHRKHAVRLRIPQYIDMEYNMVSYFRFAEENMGVQYEEIPDKNNSSHFWQAKHIQHYLNQYFNKIIN